MTFKLAVIGDSLAQGFQSGAIGHAAWSFPAILARALGLRVGSDRHADFRVPPDPELGLPIDIVRSLEAVASATGKRARFWEWVSGLCALSHHLRSVKRYYRDGRGAEPLSFSGVFHNLGTYGLTVRESYTLTPKACDDVVTWSEGRDDDGAFGLPPGHKQRSARMVLDPARQPGRRGASQLENLEYLVRGRPGLGIEPERLDALIVWLGNNDCLQTVVQLELRDMPARGFVCDPLGRPYNLTSKERFESAFDEVGARIASILRGSRTRVYVGKVPDITIPPIAKGLGRKVGPKLYERYGRFFVDGHAPHWLFHTLDHREAAIIQQRIADYNLHIEKVCKRHEFEVVDTAKVLDMLAVRRHDADDVARSPRRVRRDRELRHQVDAIAAQRMRDYAEYVKFPKHPLLELKPVPSVLMLQTDDHGERIGGGLTSLDGVHPSTIGYGIAAEGFLRRMQVDFPSLGHARIPWHDVIRHDAVLRRPPSLWDDVRTLMSRFSLPSDWVLRGYSVG